jgi:hypothetical protein
MMQMRQVLSNTSTHKRDSAFAQSFDRRCFEFGKIGSDHEVGEAGEILAI